MRPGASQQGGVATAAHGLTHEDTIGTYQCRSEKIWGTKWLTARSRTTGKILADFNSSVQPQPLKMDFAEVVWLHPNCLLQNERSGSTSVLPQHRPRAAQPHHASPSQPPLGTSSTQLLPRAVAREPHRALPWDHRGDQGAALPPSCLSQHSQPAAAGADRPYAWGAWGRQLGEDSWALFQPCPPRPPFSVPQFTHLGVRIFSSLWGLLAGGFCICTVLRKVL